MSPVHKFQSWVQNESSTELYLAVLTAIQLYGFCQHHCPLSTITGSYIGIGYIIYIIYLVVLYLELSVPLQFPGEGRALSGCCGKFPVGLSCDARHGTLKK